MPDPFSPPAAEQRQFLGHPTGLFVLFFAEMWERFSYYGMRALLVFYMLKGFLQYNDARAYAVYGAYTSLVYMTPFFGGLLADRLLGARIAVIIGGVLMASGHLVMTFQSTFLFYLALALLITGNGFFKPNISAIVGQLYAPGSPKRDGGFTIFYMGVNLGASLSPLICGYIGERYGWHYGFGLATIGMLIGLAIFVMPTRVTQVLIGAGALGTAFSLFYFRPENVAAIATNVIVAIALLAAGAISIAALSLGGIPNEAGRPRSGRPRHLPAVLCGIAVCVPLFALFVSDFSIVRSDGNPLRLMADQTIDHVKSLSGGFGEVVGIFLTQITKPAGGLLDVTGILSFGYLIVETFRLERIARQRMYVVLVLTFFSMLFWAFFEQAGSSINNFTDRNVDRVAESGAVTEDQVGTTIRIQPTQEQLGYSNGDLVFTLSQLDKLREERRQNSKANGDDQQASFLIDWQVSADNVGMGIAGRSDELAASTFQAANPLFILLFGLLFTGLWGFLGARDLDPAPPYKFALGLMQLGLGFGAFWLGTIYADSRGMVSVAWLLAGYMLQTTGELCLSPVGLSMVTKLSPKILVSTVMGGWFLATAFSQYLAAIISQFTGVSGEEGVEQTIPPPIETVNVYGDVFKQIAVAAIVSGIVCLLLAPLLKKWMHEDEAESAS
ncbi:MAG TPA: oligopeptide:H+ symporter [Lacipirellulaceae bacterium]|nr:oligopeptide:H+ symporter [Lacipirellulaceae bacterium]